MHNKHVPRIRITEFPNWLFGCWQQACPSNPDNQISQPVIWLLTTSMSLESGLPVVNFGKLISSSMLQSSCEFRSAGFHNRLAEWIQQVPSRIRFSSFHNWMTDWPQQSSNRIRSFDFINRLTGSIQLASNRLTSFLNLLTGSLDDSSKHQRLFPVFQLYV